MIISITIYAIIRSIKSKKNMFPQVYEEIQPNKIYYTLNGVKKYKINKMAGR